MAHNIGIQLFVPALQLVRIVGQASCSHRHVRRTSLVDWLLATATRQAVCTSCAKRWGNFSLANILSLNFWILPVTVMGKESTKST
jgi:hypothetical protein